MHVKFTIQEVLIQPHKNKSQKYNIIQQTNNTPMQTIFGAKISNVAQSYFSKTINTSTKF